MLFSKAFQTPAVALRTGCALSDRLFAVLFNYSYAPSNRLFAVHCKLQVCSFQPPYAVPFNYMYAPSNLLTACAAPASVRC